MATCGWLMTGVAKRLPKLPKLVMEKVPPETSSGLSWRERARAARSTMELADNGHDQAVFERHGDADIDLVVIEDVGALNRGVDDGECAQGFDGGAGDEGQEGQTEAIAFAELLLGPGAEARDLGHIDAVDGGDVGRGAFGEQHVLGDLLAHDAHGLEANPSRLGARERRQRFGRRSGRAHKGGCGRGSGRWGGWSGRGGAVRGLGRRSRGSGGGEVSVDVGLGDTSAGAGAFHEFQIEVVFPGDFADQRGDRAGGLRLRCSSYGGQVRTCIRTGGFGGRLGLRDGGGRGLRRRGHG
jgi:hypothetical protein